MSILVLFSSTVDGKLHRNVELGRCRRFCSCQSTRVQQKSADFNMQAATGSTSITWNRQNSIDFNKVWNLVRDQGVGGSNPLSPTNCFQSLAPESQLPNRPLWFYTRCSRVPTRVNTAVSYKSEVRQHPQNRLRLCNVLSS